MRFGRRAVAVREQRDVVHVDGLAAEHLGNKRLDVGPDILEAPAEAGGLPPSRTA